ncbi:MAG: TatD family hydrolase [Deltaproteobacteria bacterium]|nr:TatD family hydrolase [Deltaproteobacteria bacterium]MCB9787049.1 TatD family hydrolase [Deltaproteobacteria bacterium]
MLDAHCHIDAPAFDADRAEALERARRAGVRGFVLGGVDPPGWSRQAALALAHADVHVSYGLHPWTVTAAHDDARLDALLADLDAALDAPEPVRPVALGEIGLDRATAAGKRSTARQERAFRVQLAMARDRDLPVVLHIVRAYGRALELLSADGLPRAGGQVHAWSGSPELVPRFAGLGLRISFAATVLRPGSAPARSVAAVPPDHLLVETDAPDQPAPDRAGTRNEPAFLGATVACVAELRGQTSDAIAALTERNARQLFGLREAA